MQICLDYYRILGLPIQTSTELIEAAYSDRVQQLPQHEYSEAAIASRHDLLTEAYEVLSRPEKRLRYDGLLLKTIRASRPKKNDEAESGETTLEPENEPVVEVYAPPSLEISPDKFLGALLILFELGEYQQILRLAQPYLEKPRLSFTLEAGEPNLNQNQWRDLVLVTALAYLEIGREEWQKKEYELAAHILESGKDLLAKESLFNSLVQEIQTEIYKLRPYRVLELISLEEEKVSERMQGLQMLKEMLDARGGINGSKSDRSGLRTEDFLRFIQQLRAYLTTVEQQALFEMEARRPSEVASYLTVCALLGRGFDQKQPSLIAKAKEMLMKLSQRRDVHLERAICALLLKQIEEACRAVELSGDEEAVNAIRQKSEKDPDLLSGLCDYAEKWFDKEIFTYFRDLKGKKASLKAYFLDEEVEAYFKQESWERGTTSIYSDTGAEPEPMPASIQTIPQETKSSNNNHNHTAGNTYGTRISRGDSDRSATGLTPERIVVTPQETAPSNINSQRRRDPKRRQGQKEPSQRPTRQGSRRRPSNFKPILWGILGLGLLASGIAWARSRQTATVSIPGLEPNQLLVRLERAPIAIPSPSLSPLPSKSPGNLVAKATLDKTQAEEIVRSWLDSKAQARGKEHKIDQLADILAQPALSDQKKRAEGDRQTNSYWEYEHSFTIKSVQLDAKDKNLATIEANVREKAQFYQAGKLSTSKSGNDNLLVRYKAIKQGDRWLVSEIKVLQ